MGGRRKTSPVKSSLVKSSPVKSSLVKSSLVKSSPVKSSPRKTSPRKTSPRKMTVVIDDFLRFLLLHAQFLFVATALTGFVRRPEIRAVEMKHFGGQLD